MPTISVTTLGCKLNFSESATIIRNFIEKEKYTLVAFGQKADVTIINSCTVTAQAEKKSRNAVKKANKVSPEGKIIVIGCAAQLRPESFEKIEGVDLVLGTEQKFNVFDLLKQKTEQKTYNCDINSVLEFDGAYSVAERTRSFIKIQDGCDYKCTYCTIPQARGKSRNASISEIIEETKIIAEKGVKEIVLTGVNIGDFGRSTNENFFELVKELEKVTGIERYRISSIEPNLLTDEIIDFVAKSKKFMPHFHIPLQSGSDDILKLMKRRYNTEIFKQRILKIIELIPNTFFGIDVIVGFPGETEKHFEETYNLLKSLPISYLHIFPYSDRPGTIATEIKEKIPSEWIKEREKKLEELSKQKHNDFYKKYLNTSQKVLFEAGNKNGFISGFTENYIQVEVKYDKELENSIKQVKLNSFNGKTINVDIEN
ncbi:MAG: tRNA (N(6)-L-threonylcarbamoyladenosine(37)-C(2))-methylthiotransferase MtaB [Bacteroidales bacterium]|nr:tRNA (N(6)-L-threonylcarbamoyladenosine(37)-C(2))-methylthiotransferase MtaB [Bacteroidales bacterium]